MQGAIGDLQQTVKDRDDTIQSIHDRVAAAERKAEESMAEHRRRTREIETQFGEKERILQEQLRKQMQRMIDEQTRDIEEMQVEFSGATSLMQEKYGALERKFAHLQELY